MADYQKFLEEIRGRVAERMGEGYQVTVHKVRKVNTELQDALIILEREKGKNTAGPVFYLHPLFREYSKGTSVEILAENIVSTCREQKEKAGSMLQSADNLRDYEAWRDRIYFRLINREKNRSLLEEAPYFEVLDLAMVFYVFIGESGNGIASAMVKHGLLSVWGISPEDLKQQAEKNTPELFPLTVKSMQSVMQGFFAEMKKEKCRRGEQGDAEKTEEEADGIYIMTNTKGVNGFGAVLYPEALKNFADRMGKNLYVLPCSIHESLLFPTDFAMQEQKIADMVREVNATAVAAEEVLSDNVYFYDRTEERLTMLKEEAVSPAV